MPKKSDSSSAVLSSNAAQTGEVEHPLLVDVDADVRKLYLKGAELLDEHRLDDAMAALRGRGHSHPALKNIVGVCLLRSGRPAEALNLYQPLVFTGSGVLRPEAPIQFKTNFVTGQLLRGLVSDAVTLLRQIGEESQPGVQRLWKEIDAWKQSLSGWGRLKARLGVDPSQPFVLSFPAGDLW